MAEEIRATGHCLCKAVTITATLASPRVDACHCGMCRTWGGGPLFAVTAGKDTDLSPADKVAVYRSSEWAERAFCKVCGTHLLYRMPEADFYSIPAGVLETPASFRFEEQIFIDRKPDWYAFANDTENLTEAEVMAKFGASADG